MALEERAQMFDEHGEEEFKQEGFKKGKAEGLKEAEEMVKHNFQFTLKTCEPLIVVLSNKAVF